MKTLSELTKMVEDFKGTYFENHQLRISLETFAAFEKQVEFLKTHMEKIETRIHVIIECS